jgi:hypothetical protein
MDCLNIRVITAYHEAAHAVLGYLYGWEIGSISIEPKDVDKPVASSGHMNISVYESQAIVRTTPYTKAPHHIRVVGLHLAGMIGEELMNCANSDRTSFINDLGPAWFHGCLYLGLDPHTVTDNEYKAWVKYFLYTGQFAGPIGCLIQNVLRDVRLVFDEPLVLRTHKALVGMLLEHRLVACEAVNELFQTIDVTTLQPRSIGDS